eukprot:gene17799-24173_t
MATCRHCESALNFLTYRDGQGNVRTTTSMLPEIIEFDKLVAQGAGCVMEWSKAQNVHVELSWSDSKPGGVILGLTRHAMVCSTGSSLRNAAVIPTRPGCHVPLLHPTSCGCMGAGDPAREDYLDPLPFMMMHQRLFEAHGGAHPEKCGKASFEPTDRETQADSGRRNLGRRVEKALNI